MTLEGFETVKVVKMENGMERRVTFYNVLHLPNRMYNQGSVTEAHIRAFNVICHKNKQVKGAGQVKPDHTITRDL